MILQSSRLRIISAALAFFLFCSLIAAVRTVSAEEGRLTTPFSDVKPGHWAEKHIAKLALQQIILGSGGKFRPSDNVSQEDAVIMAVRFIGKEHEVKADDAVVFPEAFKVKDYAKSYIVYAFQAGLLDRIEEFEQAEADASSAWGSRKATREWVTKLIVRAIGRDDLANGLSASEAAFADSDQIGSGYLGYVNAAVSLGLMKGVTADKFDPKGSITRAMMATLLSRAQAAFPVDYPGQTSGLLSGLTETEISLYDMETAKEETYKLSGEALFYRYDSEQPAAREQLTLFAKVSIIVSGDTAGYIEQLNDDEMVNAIKGKIASLVPDESKIWLSVDNGFVAVRYDDSLMIRDNEGRQLQFSDLVVGSIVEVKEDAFRPQPLAISVTIQGAPVNKQAQGLVKSVDGTSVTLENIETGRNETWTISAQALISWNGKVAELADLAVGDTVSYEIVNSQITKLTITHTQSKPVNGVFYDSGSDGNTITYTIDNKLNISFVSGSVQVVIEGMNQAGLSDLIKGDNLQLTVNDQNIVTDIKVLDRKVEILNGATVLSYDADTKSLLFIDAAGKPDAVSLTSGTKFELNGTEVNLATAQTMLTKNKKITIGYTDSTAVYLHFVHQYTGKLVSLNQTTSKMTLSLANGSMLTIDYLTPYVEIYGQASASLSDVKIGDTVTASLGSNQDKVVGILVNKTVQQEIIFVDSTARKIKLKSDGGTAVEWSVGTNWRLLSEQGNVISLAGLSSGLTVNVTYAGKTPSVIKVVKVTVGKVSAALSDRLSITGTNGSVSDITLGANFRISRNGVISTSTAALQTGEWIEVRKDPEETTVVYVISGISRKFNRYDAATKVLFVLATSIGDSNVRFTVTEETKFTHAGNAITLQALKNGDQLTLYVSGGKLLEAVKS